MFEKILVSIRSLHPIKMALLAGSVLFSCVLIALYTSGVFPLALGDFVFFSGLVLLCALYRPGWAFLFFIGLLPFEIVSLAPVELGLSLRPYQWVGILTLGAVAIRFFAGRLSFSLPRMHRLDVAVAVLWAGSLLTALFSAQRSADLKQSIIVLSFVALYALVRIFIRTAGDVGNIVTFCMGSGVVVAVYALWQNSLFARGLRAFEVMPGRPNSVFAEPDWMGAFLMVAIGAVYALVMKYRIKDQSKRKLPLVIFLHSLLILFYTALILSVVRSAWLGVALMTVVAFGIVLTGGRVVSVRSWQWRSGLLYAGGIGIALAVSVMCVVGFHLTSFQLLNRAQSTASGEQRITVACMTDAALPERIVSVDELAGYGCRHINLEEVESLKAQGEIVREIYRDDPNVSIRRDIYARTFSALREHFVFGVGFGSIHTLLGTDERGAGLNASNIFLEVWLGSGLIGLLAFVYIWLSIGAVSLYRAMLLMGQKDNPLTAVYVFIVITWIGLTIFNLFNAGILLGFFWAWLAVAIGFVQKKIS